MVTARSASPETPYLQIGENKYGKPILDRIIRTHISLEEAARCALVSLDSTMKSNLTVGPPLDLAIVPHWNNNEGGAKLDTSHCYMGNDRFEELKAMLPAETVILAIDEHTACVVDLGREQARVHGNGSVSVIRDGKAEAFAADATFPLSMLRR